MNDHISDTELRQPQFSIDAHNFNVGVAVATRSVNAAIIFQHIFFWIKHNKIKEEMHKEGRTWMYQKISEMASLLPYFSEKQIQDAIVILVQHGYLIKGNFNENKFEKTSWYALGEEEWISSSQKMFSKSRIRSFGVTKSSSLHIYKDKEEDKEYIAQSAPPPREKATEISFSFEERQFEGITEKDIQSWKDLYPTIDIHRELKEMIQWNLANPSKAKSKKLWRKFILNWLQRCNEKSTNRMAYQQTKQNSQREQVLSRHTGLQQDHSPVHPSKIKDYSNLT